MKTYNEIVDNLEKIEKELPSKLQAKGDEVLADAKLYTDEKFSAGLKRQIVETLPTEDIDTNTIYMVLDESSSQVGNIYNEYMYINSSWELIGTTETASVSLYQHNIRITFTISGNYSLQIYFTIINENNTLYTSYNDLKTYLSTKGYNAFNKALMVSGVYIDLSGTDTGDILSIYFETPSVMINKYTPSAKNVQNFGLSSSATVSDKVTKII